MTVADLISSLKQSENVSMVKRILLSAGYEAGRETSKLGIYMPQKTHREDKKLWLVEHCRLQKKIRDQQLIFECSAGESS